MSGGRNLRAETVTQTPALRVVMVAEDFSKASGGVPVVVRELSERMAARGLEVHIVCSHIDPMPAPDGVTLHHVPASPIGRKWYYGHGLSHKLEQLARGSAKTIFHIHGVWAGPQYLAARIARRHGVPYIASAHGMLEPWLWHGQGAGILIKKRIYWRLFGSAVYRQADLLHTITPLEQRNLQTLNLPGPFELIPNAIDTRNPDRAGASMPREKIVLFLGRLDPKKGIDLLIRAFAAAGLDGDWRLAIVGPAGADGYADSLKALADRVAPQRVLFPGAAFGDDKASWLRRSWVMALPSYSEVIGLVNLEAAIHELPVITTHETGLDGWEQSGGLLVSPDESQLAGALAGACSWSLDERLERGRQGRSFVQGKFDWQIIEAAWLETYQRLAESRGGLPSPRRIAVQPMHRDTP